MSRPSVDVVVPFRGTPDELRDLGERLSELRLRPDDTVTVVDNGPGRVSVELPAPLRLVHAPELRTPAYARNRGAAAGDAPWLVFFDADVVPSRELLDRYFDPPPAERTGLIAGGVVDEAVPPDARPAARYAHVRALMSQEETFKFGAWGFAQTANAACRRAAFDAVGGFRDEIRAAEDADLNYRLKAAGWEVERREAAAVVHRSRQTVPAFIAQKARHGAGAAWLARHYSGVFPARRRPDLVWWGIRRAARGLLSAARSRNRDEAVWALFEPLENIAFELGRSLPNERRSRRRQL